MNKSSTVRMTGWLKASVTSSDSRAEFLVIVGLLALAGSLAVRILSPACKDARGFCHFRKSVKTHDYPAENTL